MRYATSVHVLLLGQCHEGKTESLLVRPVVGRVRAGRSLVPRKAAGDQDFTFTPEGETY